MARSRCYADINARDIMNVSAAEKMRDDDAMRVAKTAMLSARCYAICAMRALRVTLHTCLMRCRVMPRA